MTKQDINDFKSVVTNAISDIKRLNSDLTAQVNDKLDKVDKKIISAPANLEGDILRAAQEAIGVSIKTVQE